jgi:glycosyltransferase involved in cell wall biosynthesis
MSLSVILPAYNAEKTIERAINSILAQTYSDFELVIINDGSEDDTHNLISKYTDRRIRYLPYKNNRGLISVLNESIEIAKGNFVARQDADDESVARRFEVQMRALSKNDEIGIIGSATILRNSNNEVVGSYSYPETPIASQWQTLFKTPLAHSTIIAKKQLIIDAGGYDKNYKYAEDYELWTRAIGLGKIISLPEKLIYYSVEGGVSEKRRSEQDKMHIRIATENISSYLGYPVKPEIVRALSLSVDRKEEPISPETAETSIALCISIADKFRSNTLAKQEVRDLSAECSKKIASVISSQPLKSKLKNIGKFVSQTPIDAHGVFRILSAMR